MFSGIQVPDASPAGHPLERQPESEIPPLQIADHENAAPAGEFDLAANPQVERQTSDGFILHQEHPMESADLNDKMESLPESALPLPDVSNATPPPLTLPANTIAETPTADSLDKQFKADESNPADWQDLGIGMLTGITVTGIILAATSQMDVFNNLGRFVLLGGEVLCGIIGALAARSSKRARWNIWIGAIQWSLVPVWIGLFIILLVYLLTFTNFFGK